MSSLKIREIQDSDCHKISEAFQQQGWDKPVAQYRLYLEYQTTGDRAILIAELSGAFTGYLTINWKSEYLPFHKKGIPEIVDFNVLKKYQRLGIGTQLMDEAENRIKGVSNLAGIRYGVTQDYGAAQNLYADRNYKPDGNGLVKHSIPVKHGATLIIDDDITFCLTKKL